MFPLYHGMRYTGYTYLHPMMLTPALAAIPLVIWIEPDFDPAFTFRIDA